MTVFSADWFEQSLASFLFNNSSLTFLQAMELYIETLTGAAFELRVSPFETIQSVKAKIQRLEGIPINQQHLIWQTVELEDEYCLHDYDIHSGATLKLVLAMRGGPINTRRVPIEDSSLVEYMESTPEELMDKLPGSRQVTLLVFREGDQLNFFRVVDRGDGTLTPLSESLSATSMYNMYDEEDEGDSGSKERLEENAKTKEKINSLLSKMDNLSVTKKSKSATPLSATMSTNSSQLQSIQTVQSKPVSALNRNICLPPVSSYKQAPSASYQQSTNEHDYAKQTAQSAQQLTNTSMLTELTIPKPPTEQRTKNHEISQRLHLHTNLLTSPALVGADQTGASASAKPLSGKSIRRTDSEQSLGGLKKSDCVARAITEKQLLPTTTYHNQSNSTVTKGAGGHIYTKRKEALSLDKLKETLRGPNGAPSEPNAVSAATNAPKYIRRASSRQHEVRAASRQHADLTLETIKDSIYSQRLTLESLSSNEAKAMSGLLQQASLEKLGSSTISNFSPPIRTRKNSVPGFTNYHPLDDVRGGATTGPSCSQVAPESLSASSAKLPPVKSKKKGGKSAKRCFLCTKKTGLATSYICRCGNNFCAAHRYPELHDCTFDYKTEGRQLLEQNNPVVSAPKLPKI